MHREVSGPLPTQARILVRLPNALGDAVMASSVLTRLHRAFPHGEIGVAGPVAALQVLEGFPWLRVKIPIDRKGLHRGLLGMHRLARQVRSHGHWDLALILPNSIHSALPFWLAGIPQRVGYAKEGRSLLLTAMRSRERDDAGRFRPKYTGSYFHDLVDLIPGIAPVSHRPELHEDQAGISEYQSWRTKAGLADGERYFILVPGAAFGPSKIWIADRYAQVCDELARQRNARVFISYGPGEEEIANAVRAAMRVTPLPDQRLSLLGLKSIFRHADFVLTNDTGPRHMAVAFDVPNVTIMGPNDPRYTHLEGERGEVVRETPVCSPCQLKVCPLPEQVCMTQLSAARVLARCLSHYPQVQ